MENIIAIIKEITKYGYNPNIDCDDKELDLERNLIKLYAEYFEIEYLYDETEYKDFNNKLVPNTIKNVAENFPDFRYYHTVINIDKIEEKPKNAGGDAVDDLSDIIIDLIEIEWRYLNNGKDDALWFFELIFNSHTKQHIIDLINFMKSKNG